MKKIIIYGASSMAKQAYAYLSADGPYEIDCFTVQNEYINDSHFLDLRVMPFETIEYTHPPENYSMLVAVGYKKLNKVREKFYYLCKEKGYELVTYVSSKMNLWGYNEIGDNCFIYGSGNINPFTKIGCNVIIGNALIGHDSIIENHCYISSQSVIAGKVRICEHSFVGVNATIRDGVTIAPECVIGAGAIIIKDTNQGEVHLGSPSAIAGISSSQLKMFR